MINQEILKERRRDSFISSELQELLKSLGTIQPIEEDTYLFYQGKTAKEVYFIRSGLVQISMMSAQGTAMSLRLCQTDDIIGELILYCESPNYLLNARVIESGEVLAVDIKTLHQELAHNQPLAMEMMKWINNHMRKYQLKMKDLLLNGKKGALFSTLIRLSNSYGIKQDNGILIDIVLTNQDLANFCGATREYVNRLLRELRKEDILSINTFGKIFIKDLAYLKRENFCENCPIELCNIN